MGQTFDLTALGSILADRVNADGRQVVVGDASGELHIWLPDVQAGHRPAVIMPFDGMFELRLDIALRLYRWLRGQRTSLLPRVLQLTPMQKARLILMLHAHDVHEAGGGPRDVAAEVIGSAQAALPATEWKDSAARRQANRLIQDSIALVNRGYLKLLRGL
jgi:hypothetical protein